MNRGPWNRSPRASGNPYLRETRSIFAKSAYAPENNPWVKRDEMDAALLFRGAILSAYGSIETRLAEIAIRCSRLDAYASIRTDFPYAMPRRLAFLRSAFSTGPLAPFERVADAFLTRFEASAELRHMMAHAHTQASGDLVGWGATFHDYQPTKGGAITYRARRMRLAELEAEAARAARFSRIGRRLYWHLDESGLLPPVG
ncbi:hypothetical protein FIM10_18670 [Sphingomonadales bacterium 56]|uniref:Uncharacterized protein n=1 Tax=Sphingobium indicum TaxID=332055 RepID=A0A4Q4ITG4_9SPHN|nr:MULTISPECIES: hypothetical protein [Sphingobium]MBY2930707.1 hypothetical protein [Sphingomonadales bacterium 56]MBY2960751.1 hypothetical protein [Sphingomonadales bacterium 58]NYI25045.1 hypothetical protein [Sphingobium indicum]RYL96239.1 hypothetical protein EWH08_19845 [Sphingobium indicum]CAD7341789.1 hypothetical protein SPHS6_03760 [Sphingobium sp. S6]